jgi:hypothetical protein
MLFGVRTVWPGLISLPGCGRDLWAKYVAALQYGFVR